MHRASAPSYVAFLTRPHVYNPYLMDLDFLFHRLIENDGNMHNVQFRGRRYLDRNIRRTMWSPESSDGNVKSTRGWSGSNWISGKSPYDNQMSRWERYFTQTVVRTQGHCGIGEPDLEIHHTRPQPDFWVPELYGEDVVRMSRAPVAESRFVLAGSSTRKVPPNVIPTWHSSCFDHVCLVLRAISSCVW